MLLTNLPNRCLPALLAASLLGGLDLRAQNADTEPEPEALSLQASQDGPLLPTVVVVATRTEQDQSQIAATTAVFDNSNPDNAFALATSMRDYQRYEPGVTMPFSGGGQGPGRNTRGGGQGINIRGLEGNRILMQLDGIRQSDLFTFGGSTSVGRDLIDVDSLKRVELLKSAASSLYGSDALGGVVSFATKDPSDVIGEDGNNWGVETISRYDSSDDSFGNTIAAAARVGTIEWLLLYTRRDGSELDNRGATPPDPTNYNTNNFLGKVGWRPHENHTFTFTSEFFEREGDTLVNSAIRFIAFPFPPFQTFNVNSLRLQDRVTRYRFSLEHEWDASDEDWFFDQLDWTIYYQESRTAENINEDRDQVSIGGFPAPQDRERIRNHLFVQDHLGFNLNLISNFETQGIKHQIAYGAEFITSFTRRIREGREVNYTLGTNTNVIFPDTFPLKDLPDTRTYRAGIYIQDEMSWGPGDRYRLTPGARFEYFSINESPDALYLRASGGIPPTDFELFSVAPKLSFLANITPERQAYFQYATGFRAPTPEDLNASLANFVLNYQTRPNRDLKTETSHSFEVGLRGKHDRRSWSGAVFYNYYQNFIETLAFVGGTGTPADPTIFQSRNLSSAQIYGLELKGETPLDCIHSSLADFVLWGNAAYTEGYDFQNNQPLNTIDPFRLVTGIRYEQPTWQVGLITTFIARQNRTGSVAGAAPQFETPSAFTVDLVGAWQICENIRLTAGLYNLTNESYLLYQDVRGLGPAVPGGIDRFTQPGINGRVAVTITF
jgi:hemoglobin/transferrin/lactoferrin receptor protein